MLLVSKIGEDGAAMAGPRTLAAREALAVSLSLNSISGDARLEFVNPPFPECQESRCAPRCPVEARFTPLVLSFFLIYVHVFMPSVWEYHVEPEKSVG